MKSIKTEILIDAPAPSVWNVLTRFNAYSSWNPFVINISGGKKTGDRLRVLIHPPGKSPTSFKPRILEWKVNEQLRWRGSLIIPGVFDGEHYFQLTSDETGGTLFAQGEDFRGLLVPLLWRSIEAPTREGFQMMNTALKSAVESGIFTGPDVTN